MCIRDRALRVNPLKVSPRRLRELLPEAGLGDEVPWCPEGIYLTRQTPVLSKHPYYAAGLYYLQEPSAMAPASFLPVSPGDRVLDLCAAPGDVYKRQGEIPSGRNDCE